MTSLLHRRPLLLVGGGVALSLPFVRTGRAQQTYEWVAGSVGGGWYTMAAGLSALIKDENADIQIRVTPGGGLANSTRVNSNQSPIGWGIDTFAASARKGEDPYSEKHDNLRSLGTGYSPTEHHFLRRTDAGPEDMRGILTQKGLKIAVPQRSSTDEMTLQRILKFLGSSPDQIRADGGTLSQRQLCRHRQRLFGRAGGLPLRRAGQPAAMMHGDRAGAAWRRLVAFPEDVDAT